MKRMLKLFFLLFLWPFFKLWCFIFPKNLAIVLMFHSISYAKWKFAISPEAFESQMKYLIKKDFAFINSHDLYDFILHGRALGRKMVYLTFDDGYKDFLNFALPVLKKYGLAAAVFIHTDRSNKELGNNFELLNWQDIKYINEQGIEIGNHSGTHPNLKNLKAELVEEESKKSQNDFVQNIGIEPWLFAYPGGKLNQTTIDVIKRNGFKMAFTVNAGSVRRGDHPFKIRRIGITNDLGIFEFGLYVSGLLGWYNFFRAKK